MNTTLLVLVGSALLIGVPTLTLIVWSIVGSRHD